jgi:DNA replication protein DnaC
VCKGLGVLRYDVPPGDKRFGKLFPCDVCSEEARRKWLVEHCGLLGRQLELRLSSWLPGEWGEGQAQERIAQRVVARAAMESALRFGTGLMTFYGDFGAGKSMALAILVNEFCDRLVNALYVSFADLLEHLRGLVRTKAEDSPFWERVYEVPVLCVDEVTQFNDTGWAKERLFLLVNARYRRRNTHLTAFATNGDPNEMLSPDDALGYLYSRMREGGLFELRGDMRPAATPDEERWWDHV